MKRPSDVIQANKIYACIDQLLMEDINYHEKQQKKKQVYSGQISRQPQRKLTNNIKKLSNQSNQKGKVLVSALRRSPKFKNLDKQKQKRKSQQFTSIRPDLVQQDKKEKQTNKNTAVLPKRNLKLKRTVAHDLNMEIDLIKESNFQTQVNQQSQNSFLGSRQTSPTSLLSPIDSGIQKGFVDRIKHQQIKISTRQVQNEKKVTKSKEKQKFDFKNDDIKQKSHKKETTSSTTHKIESEKSGLKLENKQFCLTHDELQFLSLLYPNESPQELMVKLLSYYEQELQYKNSFQEIAYREEKRKKNYFFKTAANLHEFKGLKLKEDGENDLESENEGQKQFIRVAACGDKNDEKEETLNEYTRLKEECLAALGSQMIETQVKSSLVETANVNYYTRQYAMPHIVQFVKQKNSESEARLENLNQKRSSKNYHGLGSTKNAFLNYQKQQQSLASPFSSTNLPKQIVHKVFVPANPRGQCFDMDYNPGAQLFEYLPQNEYLMILRDVNHLIQKVLLYHRHNSFLKKKSNYLLKGWNLLLILFLISILVMLYVSSLLQVQNHASYIEIVVFFCLSFALILIMGNAFNNYKKSVKRSSLIKDICQEITSYLQFANCSSKNVKWVLGKDFFWLEIWIYLVRT